MHKIVYSTAPKITKEVSQLREERQKGPLP